MDTKRPAFILSLASAVLVLPMVAPAPSAASGERAGQALSGSVSGGGHTVTWALTGATAPPATLAGSYDGVAVPGAALGFSGSATFTIGAGFVTNLAQSAGLTGAASSASFSKRVTAGTYTLPYNLTATAPKVPAGSKPAPGDVIGSVNASVSSRNCNDYGVCDGPAVTLVIAVIAGGPSGADDEAPVVRVPEFSPIVALGDLARTVPGATTYPIRIPFFAEDDSGKVKVHGAVYSDDVVVGRADSSGYARSGRYTYRINSLPQGNGPFYLCAWAEDASGNTSAEAPKSACTWLSLQVPVSRWANGCGSDGVASGWLGQLALWAQNFIGDSRVYQGHEVMVRNACSVHDAAYAGVTLYDAISNQLVDFRTWSRQRVDRLFFEDIQRRCAKDLKGEAARTWLATCQGGFTLPQAEEFFVATSNQPTADGDATGAAVAWALMQQHVGAQLYYDLVRAHGAVGFDTDATTQGTQNGQPGPTMPAGGGRDGT